MSSSTKNGNSPAMDKDWFQDTKTSCEKQAHYFVQIRKLQDELIHREQHNLINAMERLKQLTYPRKRPVIRNFDIDPPSNPASIQKFPARNLNLRKEAKHKAIQAKEQPELNPISGKPLISKKGHKKQDGPGCHHFFVMPPLLSDRDIAKIVHNANSSYSSEPSTYLLQPHLPSIPNVGRKTTFMVDNRMKSLTLAESEFCEEGEGSVSGMRKHLHTGKSQRRKKSPRCKSHISDNASNENTTKKRGNVLSFDVDPNDPGLFSHCIEDKKEEEQYETTPLPPPNSRPSTSKSKVSLVLESEEAQGVSQADTSKVHVSGTGGMNRDSAKEAASANKNIPTEEVEMPDLNTKGDITNGTGNDEQSSDAKDLSSDLTIVENKQVKDGCGQVSDNKEAVNVTQPIVIFTSQPASTDNGETEEGK